MAQAELKRKELQRAAIVPQDFLPDDDGKESSPQNGEDLRICTACIKRVRKQAARKKFQKSKEENLWGQDEERHVVMFNTREVEYWQPCSGLLCHSGRPDLAASPIALQINAPMRIACYCRHHGETVGFLAISTIKNFQGHVVAQGMSSPIRITDNHKKQMSEMITSNTVPYNILRVVKGENRVLNVQNGAFIQPNDERSAAQDGGQTRYQCSTSKEIRPSTSTSTITIERYLGPHRQTMEGPPRRSRVVSSKASKGPTMVKLHTTSMSSPGSALLSAATTPFTPRSGLLHQLERDFGSLHGHPHFGNGFHPIVVKQFHFSPSVPQARTTWP